MNILTAKRFLFYWAVIALIGVSSCQKEQTSTEVLRPVSAYDHSILSIWNDRFIETERYAEDFRPEPAARLLALLNLTTYEACISGMPEYQSIEHLYQGMFLPTAKEGQEYYWPAVVNSAQHHLMSKLFADLPAQYTDRLYTTWRYQNSIFKENTSEAVLLLSNDFGDAIAESVWEWSKGDTYAYQANRNPYKNYNWEDHYQEAGDWRPTLPGPGKAAFPFWGQVRTFAIGDRDKLCFPPVPYSNASASRKREEAIEVYLKSGPNRSLEDQWIAEFWSDDCEELTFSTASRWLSIATQIYRIENTDLATAVYANAKIALALNDAAVACDFSKYYYNTERPESYIQRELFPNYDTPLNHPLTGEQGISPSSPSYPSDHACFAGAAAAVLADLFGAEYVFTDECHNNRVEFNGAPRTFNSFSEMANECAISRIAMGVNFRNDVEAGLQLGQHCGQKVNDLPWKK